MCVLSDWAFTIILADSLTSCISTILIETAKVITYYNLDLMTLPNIFLYL